MHSPEHLPQAGVGESITADNASWSFDGAVARTFSDHVSRSVPFYDAGHDLICSLSDFFLTNGSNCYELGCSTGSLIRKLAKQHSGKDICFYGLDSVPNMLEQARTEGADLSNITLELADITDYEFKLSDLIVSYYTIQFIRPKYRQELINSIYKSLNWGGAFLLFEKVRSPDARFQDISSCIYNDYKLSKGYTPSQILAKSRALKGVLEPFSTQGNLDLLYRAGFSDITTVFKWVSFEGFLAIK